jgi:hypothetical protein
MLVVGTSKVKALTKMTSQALSQLRGLVDTLERKINDLEHELKEIKCEMALAEARHNLRERLLEFYDKHGREDKKAQIEAILDELRFTTIATAHWILEQKYRDSIWSTDAIGNKQRIGIAPGHTRFLPSDWWWYR